MLSVWERIKDFGAWVMRESNGELESVTGVGDHEFENDQDFDKTLNIRAGLYEVSATIIPALSNLILRQGLVASYDSLAT